VTTRRVISLITQKGNSGDEYYLSLEVYTSYFLSRRYNTYLLSHVLSISGPIPQFISISTQCTKPIVPPVLLISVGIKVKT
jgi:hypothetical protein